MTVPINKGLVLGTEHIYRVSELSLLSRMPARTTVVFQSCGERDNTYIAPVVQWIERRLAEPKGARSSRARGTREKLRFY